MSIDHKDVRINFLIKFRKCRSFETLELMTKAELRKAENDGQPVAYLAAIMLAEGDRQDEIERGQYCRGNIAEPTVVQHILNMASNTVQFKVH